MGQGAKIGKTYKPVSSQIEVASLYLTAADISNWKRAIDSARSNLMPRRRTLYELYNNIILDGHLSSVIEKRRIAITNKKLTFVMDNESDPPPHIFENILDTPWMYKLLGFAIDQVAWGHSLVELIPVNGMIGDAKLIDRINVRPEDGFLQYNYSNFQDGIKYREDPYYSKYLIEFGNEKDYGRMMQAAQYVIYKRGGFGDWADFAELFGMPFRVGKYNPHDPETRDKLKRALQEAGSAGWLVIPEGSSIEFFNPTNTGQSDIFSNLIKICNEEVSKIFLGQTMTTDSGSSRSQSEVHKEVEDEISLSDMIRLEYSLNWEFKQKMLALGANDLANGNIRFQSTTELSIEKRIEVDIKLNAELKASGKELPEEYWIETYGIPNPVDREEPVVIDSGDGEGKGEGDGEGKGEGKSKGVKKKSERNQVDASYQTLITAFYEPHLRKSALSAGEIEASKKDIDPIWDRIAKGIYDGSIKRGSIDPELFNWIKAELMKSVNAGYGASIAEFAVDTADFSLLKRLENNVHVFSGYKTHAELEAVTKQLIDDTGALRNFSDFKAAVENINTVFNVAYLQVEYNQAVAASQMAEKWTGFEKQKETFPLLKYSTVGDDVVRAAHAALDGTIRPVGDSFWDTHYPPNGWNCRCTVLQLKEGNITPVDGIESVGMFANNVGKNGIIFPKDHPYFQVDNTAAIDLQIKKLDNG